MKRAGYVALALCFLVGLVVAVVHTSPVQRYALGQVSVMLAAQGVRFSASNLRYNLLGLRVQLENVVVHSNAAPDLPPLLQVRSVDVSLSLLDLLRNRYVIERGTVDQPVVHFVVDAQGRDNIPVTPKKQTSEKIDYLIQRAILTAGAARYEDRRQKLDVTIPSWQVDITGNPLTKNHDITLKTASQGQILFQGRTLPLDSIAASILLKDDAADVRSLQIASGKTTLAVDGSLKQFSDPLFDVKLATTVQLASITNLNGVLDVTATAKGPLPKLKVQAALKGRDLVIESLPPAQLEANLDYDAALQRLTVARANATSALGAAQATATIALDKGQSRVHSTFSNVDLAAVSRTAKLPVTIASRLNGTADLAFPALLYEQASGTAHLNLTVSRAPATNIVPVSGSIALQGNSAQLTARVESLQGMGVAAQGEVTLTNRTDLAGQLLAIVDLAESQTDLRGNVNVAATLSGTVKQPQAELAINGSGLQAGDQKNISLTAAATADTQHIAIHTAEVNLLQQSVHIDGDVKLTADPTLALNARIENASIASVLGALGRSDVPARGDVSATATIAGTAKQPVVDASLNATSLAAYSEDFGALTAQAHVENQNVTLTNLTLTKPGSQPLTASGTYSLQAKTFTLTAAAQAFRINALTLPDGTIVHGEFDLNASGSGSTVSATVDTRNLKVRDFELGSLHGNGTVDTNQPNAAHLTVKIDAVDLAKLPLKTEKPIEGTIAATAEATGNLTDWTKGSLTASIDPLNLKWSGLTIRTEAPLSARYNNGTLQLDRAVVHANESKLSIEGSLPLDASAPSGNIAINGALDLASLSAVAPVTARGVLNLNGTVKGTLKRIEPDVTFSLQGGMLETPDISPVSAIQIEGALREGALKLDKLAATWAAAQIESQGTVPLGIFPTNLPVEVPRQSGPAKFTLDVKGLDLASVKDIPSRVRGRASIHLDAEAPKPDINALTGKLTFPELNLTLDRVPINQQGTSTLTIQNGIARIDQFDIRGPETNLTLTGTAGLTGNYPLDIRAKGNFDMGVLASFVENVRMQGPVNLEISAGGTVKEPSLGGFIELTDGRAVIPEPSLAAENVQLRVDLQNDKLNISKLSGSLNGGTLSGGGGLRLANGSIRDAELKVRAENVYLAFPLGFKTLSTTQITLSSEAERLRLGGAVLIHEGSYTDRLSLETGLLRYIRSGQSEIELTEDRNPILNRLAYDLGIHTLSPIVVDNNLAKAEATMHLRLRGNYYRPGLTGRISMEEGAELYLNEKKYLVDRGVITFTNELRIEPELDIVARTQTGGYDITMQLAGGGGGEKIQTTLTSDPGLSEPDIIALLITGRTLGEIQGAEADIAKEQALSFLAGSLGGQLTSGLERATGISHVRIEPNLIANESDPSARLTIGQDLTKDLRVVYSMNLTDSGDQIYVAEYDVTKRFLTRAIKQSDNSYRMEVRHDLQFGGTAPPRRGARTTRTIGNVGFTGEPFFPPKTLADRFKVKTGKQYDFFQVRKGLDRIDDLYTSHGFLESRMRLKREEKPTIVDLSLDVHAGPKIEFVFEGWSVPGGTKKKIREIWHDGVFEAQRTDEASAAIRQALISDGYLESTVTANVTSREENTKRVLFDIQPGVRFHNVKLVFEGARNVPEKRLQAVVKEQKLNNVLYSNPGRVAQTLTAYYRERGYLDVKVSEPRKELDTANRTGRIVIPIAEGQRFKIGRIQFAGNNAFKSSELLQEMPFDPGDPYIPAQREQSVNRILELYAQKGYTAANVEPALARNRETGAVDVIFQITENAQRILKSIAIDGNDHTSTKLIASQVTLKEGAPLDLKELAKSRRNLYNTGAYQLVDIDRAEPAVTDITASTQIPVNLNLKVREVRPFEIKYGGYYDTERGPGGVIDITNRNSLGSARQIGMRTRYDSDLREARLYFSQPLLRRFPVKTTASAFGRRELRDAFITDRFGFSVQEEARPWEHYLITFGYRLEKTHSFEREPDPIIPFDISLRVAPLTSSFTRDTRDEIFDATRGSFTSHAFEWAPAALGSQLRFVRYFGQYFKYISLSEPSRIPWSGIRKSRLVFATAARIGLAGGLGGQDLVPSERFFAGGGTTIRGFKQDFAGPLDLNNEPNGGDALFILNNELRFPVISIFDGVGFVDIGNVYDRVRNFDITDLRKTAGLGLRVRTPYFLLRFDYGVKLGRRPEESFGRFFFSIGQAF